MNAALDGNKRYDIVIIEMTPQQMIEAKGGSTKAVTFVMASAKLLK